MELILYAKGEKFTILYDDEDHELISQYVWNIDDGPVTYARSSSHKKKTRMHRLIMGVTDPKIKIDHKNRNGLDNRRENLRICTSCENQRNRRGRVNSNSLYKGVWFSKQKSAWIAEIKMNGVKKHLGIFSDESIAAKAYDDAAIKYFGEFANLNFKQ